MEFIGTSLYYAAFASVCIFVGAIIGVLWYRYQLKNRPGQLTEWLGEFNQLKGTIEATFDTALISVQNLSDKIEGEIKDAKNDLTAAAKARMGEEVAARLRTMAGELEQKVRDAIAGVK